MSSVWRPSCQQAAKETVSPFTFSKTADGATCPTLIGAIINLSDYWFSSIIPRTVAMILSSYLTIIESPKN
jgi:hypothetical protein